MRMRGHIVYRHARGAAAVVAAAFAWVGWLGGQPLPQPEPISGCHAAARS